MSAEGLITRPFIKMKRSSNNSKGQSGSLLNRPGSSSSKFNSQHSQQTSERFLESQHSSTKAQVALVIRRSSLLLEL